jgi:hypothetical protein
MDHLVCWSNFLKLVGRLHLTRIKNPVVLFVELIICLCFMDVKNGVICLYFLKTKKGHQYGYQMKGLGSKNMFIFRIYCLFTFCKHKQ